MSKLEHISIINKQKLQLRQKGTWKHLNVYRPYSKSKLKLESNTSEMLQVYL